MLLEDAVPSPAANINIKEICQKCCLNVLYVIGSMQIESPGDAAFAYFATTNTTVDATICVENNTLAQATLLVLEGPKFRGALSDPAADTKCVTFNSVDFIGESDTGRCMCSPYPTKSCMDG